MPIRLCYIYQNKQKHFFVIQLGRAGERGVQPPLRRGARALGGPGRAPEVGEKRRRKKKKKEKREKTRPDTRPSVADGWAGAEMRVFPLFDSMVTDGPTNGRTDGRTDGQSLL